MEVEFSIISLTERLLRILYIEYMLLLCTEISILQI